MSRVTKSKPSRRSAADPIAVGTAEFRASLAKYLKQAKSGRPVVVRERGGSAYVLARLEDEAPSSIVGCMRARTEYTAGTVVNAREEWRAGDMP